MISYEGFAFPKGKPRVLDRIEKKQALGKAERACRTAVLARDRGHCRIPQCRRKAVHLHHLIYRAQGGTWQTRNIVSLCVLCHQLIHGGLLTVTGSGDGRLTVTRKAVA